MNRQILFRGLTASNEWVEGVPFFIPQEGAAFIIHNCRTLNFTANDTEFNGVPVKPKSVSQFTGLHDKHGKRIFEGDVILHWVSRWPDKKYKGIVIYTDACAAFQYSYGNALNGTSRDFMHQPHGFEIIGNIHTNPELTQP